MSAEALKPDLIKVVVPWRTSNTLALRVNAINGAPTALLCVTSFADLKITFMI